jgi:pimeloyl-ACP methyl ester carboxylesterase
MPETRFTRAGDVDIAYQVTGAAGGLDLVFVPGWVSHLEVMWELPEFARFPDRLAAMGRLICFDKRGTGLSDRVAGMPTLEQRAGDIGMAMDAVGSARAAIIAWGEGAAIASMFAAVHPERDAVRDIGTEIRAGLHTGEVERNGASVTGLAVHVGARVGALAQASEVLVTSTVQMLVLGSGIGFADRGLHTLKGVPDRWQLFAVERA